MIQKIMRNSADALTLLRLVCTALFVWAVYRHQWDLALIAILVGAFTDPLDGFVANKLKLPAKRWYGLTGKQFNEIASGTLTVLAPLALVVEFGRMRDWSWQEVNLFTAWVMLTFYFAARTILFIREKNPERVPNPRMRERSEVAQGWFAGFIVVCCGAQVLWLAHGWYWLVWADCALALVVGVLLSRHRWSERPEVWESV